MLITTYTTFIKSVLTHNSETRYSHLILENLVYLSVKTQPQHFNVNMYCQVQKIKMRSKSEHSFYEELRREKNQ